MAFSVVEFGLPACTCGSSLWRVSLSLTPVVLQLCSLPYSPYLYLQPYSYGTPRKGKLFFVRLWQLARAGFLGHGLLLFVLLLGIRLLIFHQSPSDLIWICLLQVFGLLRLKLVRPLLLFLLALIAVFAFCGFILLVLILGVAFSVSPSFSFTMTIAWVVASSSSSSSPFT